MIPVCYVMDSLPLISLKRLDKLGGSIIVWDVEPETMRNSCRNTFSKTERISTNKICTISVWII